MYMYTYMYLEASAMLYVQWGMMSIILEAPARIDPIPMRRLGAYRSGICRIIVVIVPHMKPTDRVRVMVRVRGRAQS